MSANTSDDARPPRSKGLNSGASIGVLVSTTMRPPKSGRSASAAGSYDQFNETKKISFAATPSRLPASIAGPMAQPPPERRCGPRDRQGAGAGTGGGVREE